MTKPASTTEERATATKDAVIADWNKGTRTFRRDGQVLTLDAPPAFIYNAKGELVGVDAWVRLHDSAGNELPIDPHRIFVNPPTVYVGKNGQREASASKAFEAILWDSVAGTPNPAGWRTSGTVTTVFSTTADGYVYRGDGTYSNAREGIGGRTADASSNFLEIGQVNVGAYFCYEGMFSFDTSSIPDTNKISAATFSLYGKVDSTTTDFVMQARLYTWGASLTTADWIPGSELTNAPLLAHFDTSGFSTAAYNDFTNDDLVICIDKTGVTYILVNSDRHAAGTSPSGEERLQVHTAEASGTTNDPKLVVTHSASGSAVGASATGTDDGYWDTAVTFYDNNSASYSAGDLAGTSSINAWGRVSALAIPTGSTVNAARLVWPFAVTDAAFTGVHTRIYGVKSAAPTAPTGYADADSRTLTTAFVDYDPGAFTTVMPQISPDISAVVQELVDAGYFHSGAVGVFYIKNDSSSAGNGITFNSYDHAAGDAMRVVVNFTPPAMKHFLVETEILHGNLQRLSGGFQ